NQKHLGMSKEVGTPRYLSLVVPLKKVGDEAVHKEFGDRMERAATTASSLEVEQESGSGPRCQDTIMGDVNAQTRFEIASKPSNDQPLSRGYTLGSGEDSMKLFELMEFCAQLQLPRYRQLMGCASQIHAYLIKRVIVTESSIRRDLHLDDAEGTDCLPTATIFEELARMGCSMASLIICLATNQKFNMSKYIFDAMVKHLDGGLLNKWVRIQIIQLIPLKYILDQPSTSSKPKKKQTSKKTQRQEAEVSQDETEHEESVPIPSNDPQASGKDSMQLTDLMVLCTKLQTQVLDLEKAKDAQVKEIS
ncbi:hypothetical protein Tco_0853080, partial [Tanacetum coccineum]